MGHLIIAKLGPLKLKHNYALVSIYFSPLDMIYSILDHITKATKSRAQEFERECRNKSVEVTVVSATYVNTVLCHN